MKPLILAPLCAGILLISCGATNNGVPSQNERGDKMQKIYVDDATYSTSVRSGDSVAIEIKGNLPSPAYEFERFEVDVRGNTIEITPLASYDGDKIVTQMLIPFQKTCNVGKLKAGQYDVRINTRSETVVKKEKITVR